MALRRWRTLWIRLRCKCDWLLFLINTGLIFYQVLSIYFWLFFSRRIHQKRICQMWSNFLRKSLLFIFIAHYYFIEHIITLSMVFLQLLRHFLRLGFWMVWFVGRSLLETKLTHFMWWTSNFLLDECICNGCLTTCIQKKRVFDCWILPAEMNDCLMADRAICEHMTSFCLMLTGFTFIGSSRWLAGSLLCFQHRWNWPLRSALIAKFILQIILLESRSVDRNWWIVVRFWDAILHFGLVFWII